MTLPATEPCDPHEAKDPEVEADGGSLACAKSYKPGQLEAATVGSEVPKPVAGVHDAIQLAAGDQFACALTSAGEIWCWGDNALDQLGTHGATPPPLTAARAAVPPASAIASSSSWNACALARSGEVWCWGQIWGLAGNANELQGPARVGGLDHATSIAVGGGFGCATLDDGGVSCWGHGRDGETGHGARDHAEPPARVNL